MIEAVNSVISNASLLRQSAQQVAVAVQASESAESVAKVPLAPYISPAIHVNYDFDTAVLAIRDSDTGDVLAQFPSESALEARQRAEAVRDRSITLQQQRTSSLPRPESLSAGVGQGTSSAAPAVVKTDSGPVPYTPVASTITVAQQSGAPQQSIGAGAAQVAIAALSTGAQSGQSLSGSVSVTA